MTDFKVNDTVKYNASCGSWGIVTGIHENFSANNYDQRYIVKWYYGKDVKGEYMTSISRYVKGSELIPVTESEFWQHANRNGFSNELGESTPGPIFVKEETILWFKGPPKVSGPYMVQKEGFWPNIVEWDSVNKEFSSHDGELLSYLDEGTIYYAAIPRGITK